MPPRLGQSADNDQGGARQPAAAAPPISQPINNRPPEASYSSERNSRATARDDDGIEFKEGDDQPYDGGGRWPRADEFGLLAAGDYDFIACVNGIVRWHFGTIVTLRVIDGKERGRDIDWAQTPHASASAASKEVWRRIFFGAYAAGGWTVAPDESRKWDGWEASNTRGSDGKPLPVPPYDRFFVGATLADGIGVPCALRLSVRVDAGWEKYTKVTSVSLLRDANGDPVQAPAPFRVVDWIAERNGWRGVLDDKLAASQHVRGKVIRLDQKQVPKNAAGLQWYTDALKAMRKPGVGNAYGDRSTDDIPF